MDKKNLYGVIFDTKAQEVYSEVYEGGGGTIVVTELPEVGEPHTIYELQETTKATYNWVAYTPFDLDDGLFPIHMISQDTFIFDTYEQMTSVFENIAQPSEPLEYYFAYIRNEDKLYVMQPNGESWSFEERVKISAYTFARPDSETGSIYILKSYEGYDEATEKYYGTLYDGTKVELLFNQDLAFILTQVVDCGYMEDGLLSIRTTVHPVTTLPTAEELVANYLSELVASWGLIVVEIDGQVKQNTPNGENYDWLNDPNIGAPNFYTVEEDPVVYTGELEWEDIPDFDTIPYQEIVGEGIRDWIFQPKKGGEIISTYWIYTNNEWINIDDIKNPTDYIAIPFNSFGDNATPIPLDKIHIYLDGSDTQLDIIPLDSSVENYYGLIYIQRDEEITTEPHTFKFVLDNDVTFGDLGAIVNLTGFWSLNTSSAEVNQETFTATVSGEVGKLELSNASDNPK